MYNKFNNFELYLHTDTFFREFTQELKAICDTGIVTDMYKTDAILHLVLAVAHESMYYKNYKSS